MPRRIYPNLHAYFADHPRTMNDIAHELGISLSFLSMILWGSREPKLRLALALARRCQVPLESLLAKPESR